MCAVNTWGLIKYLIGRMDKQNEGNQQSINALRAQVVTREEHTRDYDRLRAEVADVRNAIDRQGLSLGARLDQILLHLGAKPKN